MNAAAKQLTHGPALRWPLPAALTSGPAVRHRNDYADRLAALPPAQIVESYVYLSRDGMRQLVTGLARRYLPRPFTGIGLELGAGCALLASVVASSRQVQRVYAVEICERMVDRIIPQVAAWVLGRDAGKIVPVVGSFDDLRLPDASVDFVVEIDSLHHSNDLARTVTECARVLKPGGLLVCFDRCHPDTLTDQEVDEKLSRVYPRAWLEANAYPPELHLTRRDNGEHEYRMAEWKSAFAAAGLRLLRVGQTHRAMRLSAVFRRQAQWIWPGFGVVCGRIAYCAGQRIRHLTGYYERQGGYLAARDKTFFVFEKPGTPSASAAGTP